MSRVLIIPCALTCALLGVGCSGTQGLRGLSGGHRNYVSQRSSRHVLDLAPNGEFTMLQDEQGAWGRYEIAGEYITYKLANGTAVRSRIVGDTIIDSDGERWVRQEAVTVDQAAAPRTNASDPTVAVMKSDLRNLITAEEAYFADHVTYAGAVSQLNYASSAGVTVTIRTASGTGWSALATHAGAATTCGVFVGTAPAPMPGQAEGSPQCQ